MTTISFQEAALNQPEKLIKAVGVASPGGSSDHVIVPQGADKITIGEDPNAGVRYPFSGLGADDDSAFDRGVLLPELLQVSCIPAVDTILALDLDRCLTVTKYKVRIDTARESPICDLLGTGCPARVYGDLVENPVLKGFPEGF